LKRNLVENGTPSSSKEEIYRIASKIERTERERKASKSERVLMVCN
jgi:hypothetical protein